MQSAIQVLCFSDKKYLLMKRYVSCWHLHCVGELVFERNGSSSAATVLDQKCSSAKRSRMKNWQQSSLTAGTSFELEPSSSSALMVDEPGTSAGRRRGSLLQSTAGRRGSALHGQISTTSESSSSSSSSSSERRRSSCLSDVSVRSSSSKRSSTGDFSSELEEYFDNIAHRSLQTAVIEEEVTQESVHDASVSGRQDRQQSTVAASASRRMSSITGQNLLEHFVDNLINEAAQQSKIEIEQCLAQSTAEPEEPVHSNGSLSLTQPSESLPRLEQYASNLAEAIITVAVQAAAVKERQQMSSTDLTRPRPSRSGQTAHHGRRIERQQTVSGFRDTVLSDFDNRLMSSNIASDVAAVPFADSDSKKRRSSEPASLNYSKNMHMPRTASPISSSSSTSSSVDHREVIAGWFTSNGTPAEHCVADGLTNYIQNLVIDAFVESVKLVCRHRRRQKSSKSAVPDAILSYADRLTNSILQSVRQELRTSAAFDNSHQQTSLQSVAEKFARSIVDDALAFQTSSAPRHLLVSCTRM